jgi:hypothetical protein
MWPTKWKKGERRICNRHWQTPDCDLKLQNSSYIMLEIRPTCENCGKLLPYDSLEAQICSFECTFCNDCVEHVLHNVCPNCGGGFEKRPIRPKEKLAKNPVRADQVFKPVDKEKFLPLLVRNQNIPPALR